MVELNEKQLKALRTILSYMDEDLEDWTEYEKQKDKAVVNAVKILHEVKKL